MQEKRECHTAADSRACCLHDGQYELPATHTHAIDSLSPNNPVRMKATNSRVMPTANCDCLLMAAAKGWFAEASQSSWSEVVDMCGGCGVFERGFVEYFGDSAVVNGLIQ